MIDFSGFLGKLNRARKNPTLYRIIFFNKVSKFLGIKIEKDRNSIEWAFLLSDLSNFNVSDGGFVLSKKRNASKKNITKYDPILNKIRNIIGMSSSFLFTSP